MSKYIVVLAAVVILLIPQTRKAAVQVLGLLAIAAVGIAGIGLPVWALYQAKPLLTSPDAVVEDAGARAFELGEEVLSVERKAERRRREEERQAQELRKREEERRAEEQRRREEEQLRIASLAESARAIVERDRRYASVMAFAPRLSGADRVSADLITIRIPSWRDDELAGREKDLIRAWMQSIGLTSEETASIHTANGWGSVYDLWRKEKQIVAGTPAPGIPMPVASGPEPEAKPETELATDPEAELAADPEAELAADLEAELATGPEMDLELPQVVRQELPSPRVVEPRRESRPVQAPPRRRESVRRPAPEREVGPFGY